MSLKIANVSALRLHAELLEKNPSPTLIDVRSPREYYEANIHEAVLMPLDEFSVEALLAKFDPDTDFVFVCQSGRRAQCAAKMALDAGLKNVRILNSGMTAWKRQHLAISHAGPAVSLERQVRIIAGSLVLLGVILGTWVHPNLYGISAFVGAGLAFAGITDSCAMASVLSLAPWNRSKIDSSN